MLNTGASAVISLRGAKPSKSDANLDTWVVVVSGSVAFVLCPLIAFLCWSFCRHHEYGLFPVAVPHREEDMVSEPSNGDYMCPTRTAQPVLTHSLSGFLSHVKSGKQGEYVGHDTSRMVSDASGSLAIEAFLEPQSGTIEATFEAFHARDAEAAVASKASDAEVSWAAEASDAEVSWAAENFVWMPQSQARGAEITLAIEAAEVGQELVVVPLRPGSPASVKDDDEQIAALCLLHPWMRTVESPFEVHV